MSNPFDPHDAELRAQAQAQAKLAADTGDWWAVCPYAYPGDRHAFWLGYDNLPSHRLEAWRLGRMVRLIHDEGQP